MQHVDVHTQIEGEAPETFTLTRPHVFSPWQLLGCPFTLYPIYPGRSYAKAGSSGWREITVSEIY